MFITFEFLIGSLTKEKIEVVISTPKEAAAFVFFLETTERVRAFKMSPCSPRDLGMAPNESFTKYRENGFTKEDYCDPYSSTMKTHKQHDEHLRKVRHELIPPPPIHMAPIEPQWQTSVEDFNYPLPVKP